ncbi:MAG: hypothetical protein JWO36_2032 [Myxococcales bacterium]|nr:hypothetical protein [Myxococcales bacterium]
MSVADDRRRAIGARRPDCALRDRDACRAVLGVALLLTIASCHTDPTVAQGTADDLAVYLRGVARLDTAAREREVSTWIADEATWRRAIVEPYRALWPDYMRSFDARVPALVARLGTAGAITTRRHYAGDARGTLAQGRLRWAEPVQAPSYVAELAGAPIDTVFIFDGAHWRVLAGLDEIVLAHVKSLDRACGGLVELAGALGPCTEVGWVIADAALRADDVRFAHACKLAATLCGNRSP